MPASAESKDLPSPVTRRSKRRRVLFPLIAIVLALVPFVLLEIVLRTVDVGDPTGYVDPFVGFGRAHPLFSLARDQQTYETTRSHQLYFGTQEFSAKKPANMVRVFCLGGSTVRGRPYTTKTSFSRWLQIELKLRDPSREYEVINCGGLSYASYRLARITEEVIAYQPDLIVMATGHNEFLEDRTYQDVKSRSSRGGGIMDWLYSLRIVTLARQLGSRADVEEARESEKTVMEHEVKARLDDQSGYASYHRDDEWQKQVVKHFGHSLRAIIKMCDEHKVPLVLVGLGSNLRDCPPFKSELATTLKDSQRTAFQLAYEAGEREEGNPQQALKFYRKAEAIDAGHALLNYRMARCFDRLPDQAEQAADYYIRAKDTDVCPLRMVEDTYQQLLKVCRQTKTPLVDVRVSLEKLTPEGIPGYDQYMDHVHPTIRTHQFIAQRVADQLEQQEFIASNASLTDEDRRQAYRNHFDQLKDTYLVNGRRRVGWLEKWARRSLLARETTPFDARGYLELGKRKLLFDESGYAWSEFDRAIALDTQNVEVLLGYAQKFFHGGQYYLSRNLLDELLKHEMAKDYAVNIELALLIVALELGKDEEVVEIYTKRTDELQELAKTRPLWLESMPDVLQRAQQLAAKSK
jgi:tetratricopeptide (TPR) repeat protein